MTRRATRRMDGGKSAAMMRQPASGASSQARSRSTLQLYNALECERLLPQDGLSSSHEHQELQDRAEREKRRADVAELAIQQLEEQIAHGRSATCCVEPLRRAGCGSAPLPVSAASPAGVYGVCLGHVGMSQGRVCMGHVGM